MSNLLNDDVMPGNDPLDVSSDKYAKSLSGGLIRLTYLLKTATNPMKYKVAFDLAISLMVNFPMKGQLIWKTVSDSYQNRFINV